MQRVIGSGGFGKVYLAHDTELDRPVAIKVLKLANVSPPEVDQFLEEARRVARLRHPGIVTVHDIGTHDGQVYIVSDFLSGPSLAEWLIANRPNWLDAARIVAAIADALAHAHSKRTVHRDVKPVNIIFTAEQHPVLVDFGLGLDEARAGGQELGLVSGTPRYMAPEQVSGEAHRIDGRTDIYSLGVVLYEMLCGYVPFRGTDSQELLRQIRDDEPQPPRQLVNDIPPALEEVCLRAMAKRISDRYRDGSRHGEGFTSDRGADCRVRSPGVSSGSGERSFERPARPIRDGLSVSRRYHALITTAPARGRTASDDGTRLRLRPVRVRSVPGRVGR